MTHAFLGSHLTYANTIETPHILSEDDSPILGVKENLCDLFPTDFKMILKGNPPASNEVFRQWLKRVTKCRGNQWKQQGIYDRIQLSGYDLRFKEAEIFSALHFWHQATNSFHLLCGMLSPTLF